MIEQHEARQATCTARICCCHAMHLHLLPASHQPLVVAKHCCTIGWSCSRGCTRKASCAVQLHACTPALHRLPAGFHCRNKLDGLFSQPGWLHEPHHHSEVPLQFSAPALKVGNGWEVLR